MPGYFSTIALMPEIKTGTCSTCFELAIRDACSAFLLCVPDAVARFKL